MVQPYRDFRHCQHENYYGPSLCILPALLFAGMSDSFSCTMWVTSCGSSLTLQDWSRLCDSVTLHLMDFLYPSFNIIPTYHFIIHELILVFFLSCLSCSTSIEIPEAQGFLHHIWWTYTPTDIVALKMVLGDNIGVCDLHSKGLFLGSRDIMKYLGTKSSPLPDRISD